MKILFKNLTPPPSLYTLILVCILCVTFNSCDNNDDRPILSEDLELSQRSSESYYYDLLYNDANYRTLVKNFDSKNYNPDFSDRSNVDAVVSDSNMKEIRRIWREKLPTDAREQGIAQDQFHRATTDLQLQNHQGQISAFPCPDGSNRNYGEFVYSLNKLDCEELVQEAENLGLNGACCARVYCNEVNCLVDVYKRFTQNSDIVLDGDPFRIFISFWYQQKENPLFVAIGIVTAADAFVVAVGVQIGSGIYTIGDLIYSSLWCHFSSDGNDSLGNKCECDCPNNPECNAPFTPIFGGYIIPDDCE